MKTIATTSGRPIETEEFADGRGLARGFTCPGCKVEGVYGYQMSPSITRPGMCFVDWCCERCSYSVRKYEDPKNDGVPLVDVLEYPACLLCGEIGGHAEDCETVVGRPRGRRICEECGLYVNRALGHAIDCSKLHVEERRPCTSCGCLVREGEHPEEHASNCALVAEWKRTTTREELLEKLVQQVAKIEPWLRALLEAFDALEAKDHEL